METMYNGRGVVPTKILRTAVPSNVLGQSRIRRNGVCAPLFRLYPGY